MIAEQRPLRHVIRRSLAENLLTCPTFVREDNEVLAFGQAAHSFFAAYFLQCRAANEETRLTDVTRLAGEAWARTHGLQQGRFAEFMQLCEFFALTWEAGLETLSHLEHTETLEVGEDLLLTATMDRIDRADQGDPDDPPSRELITDFKTERAELDHDFQMRWYAQQRLLGSPALSEVGVRIAWVRDAFLSDTVWYRRGELDFWWKTMLAGLRDRLAQPDPQPVGGPSCPDCAKRFSCGKATAVAREIPEDEAQADELFQDLLRLEEAREVRHAGLKHFYGDRQPRVVHGHELGYLTPREARLVITAAPLELHKWLKRHHYDADAALKVDSSAVAPVQHKLVEAGLAKHEFSKAGFRWRKFVAERKKVRKHEEEAQ